MRELAWEDKGLNILTLWSYTVRGLAWEDKGLNILTLWSYTVRGLAWEDKGFLCSSGTGAFFSSFSPKLFLINFSSRSC